MIEHEFGYPEVTLYDTALRRMSSCRSVHLVRTLPGSLGVDRLCEHGGSGAEATLVFGWEARGQRSGALASSLFV